MVNAITSQPPIIIDCGWTTAENPRKCMYFRTFPAMERLAASADKECTDLVTRTITIPDEIYGFTFWTFCESHWHIVLKWALRQDRKEMDERGLN